MLMIVSINNYKYARCLRVDADDEADPVKDRATILTPVA